MYPGKSMNWSVSRRVRGLGFSLAHLEEVFRYCSQISGKTLPLDREKY